MLSFACDGLHCWPAPLATVAEKARDLRGQNQSLVADHPRVETSVVRSPTQPLDFNTKLPGSLQQRNRLFQLALLLCSASITQAS